MNDQTYLHLVIRNMAAGLLECGINTTEDGAKNTLIKWGTAVRARCQDENLTPQHDPNAYAALVVVIDTHFKMTDMHQKKTHTLLESVLTNQNKMSDEVISLKNEVSILAGLIHSLQRDAPQLVSNKPQQIVASIKRSRTAVDFHDDGMNEDINCDEEMNTLPHDCLNHDCLNSDPHSKLVAEICNASQQYELGKLLDNSLVVLYDYTSFHPPGR